MIEHILKSCDLSVIIDLSYPNISYIFLHKYVNKINWIKFFEDLNNYKGILSFLRTNFKMEYFKATYLFSTSENRYLKIAKFFLQKGANLNAYNDYALSLASEIGHFKVVNLFLENGANIHAGDDNPLISASKDGKYKVVKLLLEKGADVHAQHDLALKLASQNGHFKVVNLLLQNGADLHNENDRALRIISQAGVLGGVRILLGNVANVHAQDDEAIHYASINGHLKVIRILMEGANIYANYAAAIKSAIRKSDVEAIKIFLEKVDEIPYKYAVEIINLANNFGNLKVVKIILQKIVYINYQENPTNKEIIKFLPLLGAKKLNF